MDLTDPSISDSIRSGAMVFCEPGGAAENIFTAIEAFKEGK